MEDSVKDLDGDINPTTPEPRFSIGSKSPDNKNQIYCHFISGDWKQTFKSMNDDDDWVICSNRQNEELDGDIRSVSQLFFGLHSLISSCIYIKPY